MPELPEVETVAHGLRTGLIGRRVSGVELRRASIFRGEDPAVLKGGRVLQVDRAGKYLILEIETATARWQLMVHLGMTGQLLLHSPRTTPASHTHAIFTFQGGRELHFRDPRRFGRIALARAPEAGMARELGIASGIEPLLVTEPEFAALFQSIGLGVRGSIKGALLDQKRLRGLGNIYVDESLFRAGIHPRARALSRPRLAKLRLAIRTVLKEAITAGGSSISDYRNSDGKPGWFHLNHRVYGRTGQPCLQCRSRIHRIVLSGRSTHFCPKCQRL